MFGGAKIKLGKHQNEGSKQVKVTVNESQKKYYIQRRVNCIESKQDKTKKKQKKQKLETFNDPALKAQIMEQIERFDENLKKKNINMDRFLQRKSTPKLLDSISECSECSIDSLSGVT